MTLSREEIKLEEARLKHRTAWILCLTAALGLVAYVTGVAADLIKYRHTPREIEDRANRDTPRCPNCPVQPYLVARPDGPDLRIEAGLDLRIDTEVTPDGQGQLTGEISDYPPGKYRLEDAPNAQQVVALLHEGLGNFLNKDLSSFKVETEIIGSADGIPVRDGAVYRGDLGPIQGRLYFSYDEGVSKYMTLVPHQTPLSNEILAFLRAYALIQHTKSISALKRAETSLGVSTTAEVGGQHRRVIIKVAIKGALQEEYDALGPIGRWLHLKLPKPD